MKKTILILILVLFWGCQEQIVHNLTEKDANRLLTKLSENNIQAEKIKEADGTWAIAVDKQQSVAAIKYLEGARALQEPRKEEGKSSIISSREEQRFHFERAQSAEIEQTLLSLSSVLEARVHLNLAPKDPLFGQSIQQDTSSASVLLVVKEDFTAQPDQIKQLVAGASGIPAEKISVLINQEIPVKSSESDEKASAVKKDPTPQATAVPERGLDPLKSPAGVLDNFAVQLFLSISIVIAGLAFYLIGLKRKKNAQASRLKELIDKQLSQDK